MLCSVGNDDDHIVVLWHWADGRALAHVQTHKDPVHARTPTPTLTRTRTRARARARTLTLTLTRTLTLTGALTLNLTLPAKGRERQTFDDPAKGSEVS